MNILVDIWLSLFCRRYFSERPVKDDSSYTVRAFTMVFGVSEGCSQYHSGPVRGSHVAYRRARTLALKLDREVRNNEIEIRWEMAKIEGKGEDS